MTIKAYKPAWSRSKATQEAAAGWQRQGLLSLAQLDAINAAHPLDYYRPNVFLRIALFIFTCIGSLAVAGFFGLGFGHFLLTCLICLTAAWVVLEVAINSSQLYHSGIDNALLYMSLSWTAALVLYGVNSAVPEAYRYGFSLGNPFLPWALVPILALLTAATTRYADRLVAALAYLVYIVLIINILTRFSTGQMLLPFALMLASGVAYYAVRKLLLRVDYFYYQTCFTVLKALALSFFYLSGNYLIVREGNAQLHGLATSTQVPFAVLFYFFTASIPLAYLYVGLRRHDRVWLLIGLLSAAFSFYTLRYYRSLLPPEVAATVAGAILTALTFGLLRYLRTPRHGLTAAEDGEPKAFTLESLVIAQTAYSAPHPQPAGFEFGGGHSGGGGADGSY